jgi:hypothetical protein
MRRPTVPSQAWRNGLRSHIDGIASVDVLVAESASFRLLYLIVILSHDRRKISRFDSTEHPAQGGCPAT